MTGGQGRRRKHLLDGLRRIRSCSAMKEEIVHRTLWRTVLEETLDPCKTDFKMSGCMNE
jgi:hypothetical protein